MQRHSQDLQPEAVLAMSINTHRLSRGRGRGFTLIELMVTVAIAAVLLMVAAPSFVTFKRSSELASSTNSLVGAISMARGEALKRGRGVVIIPKDGDWKAGWLVFVDNNGDQLHDATEAVIAREDVALPDYFTVTGTGTALGGDAFIMFDASGYTKTSTATYQAASLTIARNDLSGSSLAEQTRRIVIAKTGRVRACKPATDTTCTDNATE